MAKEDIATAIQSARDLFMQVMEIDGLSDRSGCLALIELEKRARDHGAPSG
jgi:N-terminal acetyltransferase B complex non-catalytic subunit